MFSRELRLKLYVAVTDRDWFNYLASSGPIDEVNFWQPSGGRQFRALQPGEPFLFKLHSPQNYIVGGGFFGYFTVLPVSFAWSAFATKNSSHTEHEMRARIARYRRVPPSPTEDQEIGCILLQAPFFFAQDDWIPASDWRPHIVQGRRYDTADTVGESIWQQVRDRLDVNRAVAPLSAVRSLDAPRHGAPQVILPRLGHASFRVVVTDAYQRRCALTSSPILPVLDAVHIKPFAEEGPHDVRNGILLRQDVHTLFDRGYLTVTPDYRVEVGRRIKEEFENGHEYYAAHGKVIRLPQRPELRPSREFLEWHNQARYVG